MMFAFIVVFEIVQFHDENRLIAAAVYSIRFALRQRTL